MPFCCYFTMVKYGNQIVQIPYLFAFCITRFSDAFSKIWGTGANGIFVGDQWALLARMTNSRGTGGQRQYIGNREHK